MDPFTITLLTSLVAAGAAGGYAGGSIGNSSIQSDQKVKAANQLKKDIMSDATLNDDVKSFINGLGTQELIGLIEPYSQTKSGFFGKDWEFNEGDYNATGDVIKDLAKLIEISSLSQPEAPDYQAIYDAALNEVETENEDTIAKWDEDVNRRKNLFNQQLSDSNAAYNQNVEQILSNDYQNNARLLGTMRSEMQRSQRNALEAGASAGIRIAGNINTMLSAQNQQAQQSLATSNNLAQMLLNQQQANAGLRNDYANYMSQDTQRKTDLTNSTADRAASRANTNFGIQNTIYGQKMNDYEDAVAKLSGNNPFASSYQAYSQGQSYLNKIKNKPTN